MTQPKYSIVTFTKSNGANVIRINKEGKYFTDFGGFELLRMDAMYKKYGKEIETITDGFLKLTEHKNGGLYIA